MCLDGPCRAAGITSRITAATAKRQLPSARGARCSALSPPSPPSVAGRLQPLRISVLIVSRMLRKWNCAECSFGLLRPASFSGKWARWLHFHFCRVCSTVWMYHSLLSCREAAGLFPVFASYKLSHCGTYVQVSVNISPPFPGMNAQESSCWLVQ